MDFQALGTALGGLAIGAGGVGLWWRQQRVAAVSAETEISVIQMLRDEVGRLSTRVTGLEAREGRLIRHVYRLEGLMRAANIEPPPFELDPVTPTTGGPL